MCRPCWRILYALLSAAVVCGGCVSPDRVPIDAQGTKIGEVTSKSAILHVRLASRKPEAAEPYAGQAGFAAFVYATEPNFSDAAMTDYLPAESRADYCVKVRIDDLQPGALYYYRAVLTAERTRRPTLSQLKAHGLLADPKPRTVTSLPGAGPFYLTEVGRFRTAPAADQAVPVVFAVITSQSYGRRDSPDGHLAYRAIEKLGVDFIVPTGDNVYYDACSDAPRAVDEATCRLHWHRMYALPIQRHFYRNCPAYWEKDDHDWRFNDADPYKPGRPSARLGTRIFNEQHPLGSRPYRTFRWGRLLQIWLTEGREYRGPNRRADGPDKSLWGSEQKAWLKRTILESDAVFKVLISPTPLVGPDSPRKRDNHADPGGFFSEGLEFFAWLRENRIKGFYICCGDRHWQYHSVHPSGYQEFCCGPLCEKTAVKRPPTRPDIRQPYLRGGIGGFLLVRVLPNAAAPLIRFEFYDKLGTLQYAYEACPAEAAP